MTENFSQIAKELCDLLGIPYDLGKGRATLDGRPMTFEDLEQIFLLDEKVCFEISVSDSVGTSKKNARYEISGTAFLAA